MPSLTGGRSVCARLASVARIVAGVRFAAERRRVVVPRAVYAE